eukprot:5798206-Pyramimonas_sp.AAC.1
MPILADTGLFTDGSLGASVEPDDRQARRGRINTVRFNPREGSTTMAGKVAHRGNLDYQDCRRTLTDGYEYDNSEDYLRPDTPLTKRAGLPPILHMHRDGLRSLKFLSERLRAVFTPSWTRLPMHYVTALFFAFLPLPFTRAASAELVARMVAC